MCTRYIRVALGPELNNTMPPADSQDVARDVEE